LCHPETLFALNVWGQIFPLERPFGSQSYRSKSTELPRDAVQLFSVTFVIGIALSDS
jgi:hypothetical protein